MNLTKKVCIFTGTRAEYGLLYWLIKDISSHQDLSLQLLVSGMHLSPEFGGTSRIIEEDGFHIDEKIEMLLSSDSPRGTAKSIGVGIIGYADALDRLRPDLIIVLGDRFEALAIAQTAMIMRIPVFHIHGGEITEGAYDDAIRHAITKLSYFHFTSAEVHRRRVIQLGETPERVINVGAIGLDHVNRSELLSKQDLSYSLGFSIDSPFFIVTYHPVTAGDESSVTCFENIIKALNKFQKYKVIISYPNSDDGGRAIIPLIESFSRENRGRILALKSFGHIRYLSALKYCSVVIGNSSSGIIEAPSFQVPTVNVGVRQKGRLAAKSVFNVGTELENIVTGIKNALKAYGSSSLLPIENPYGSGNASKKIIQVIEKFDSQKSKSFYDYPYLGEHIT